MTKKQNQAEYHDFKNVEAMHNYVIPEATPEGPYGSPFGENSPVEGKSTEWKPGQRTYSAFNYVNKDLHQHTPRKYPGHHPPHDSTSD